MIHYSIPQDQKYFYSYFFLLSIGPDILKKISCQANKCVHMKFSFEVKCCLCNQGSIILLLPPPPSGGGGNKSKIRNQGREFKEKEG